LLRRKPAFTSRAAVLAVVVAALALALAGPMRELLSQRVQVSSLNNSIASSRQQIAQLQKTQKQLANPSYIEAQARDRLHYVFPGQVPYVTLTPTPSPAASAAAALASQPWYGQLWASVEGASGVTPSPSPSPTPSLAPALVPRSSAPALAPASAPVSDSAVAPPPATLPTTLPSTLASLAAASATAAAGNGL
jgi:cell division protein FtsB